jgi:hypothetical protein
VASLDLFSDSIISPFGADDEPERGTYRARAVSPDSRERGATRFSTHGWRSGSRNPHGRYSSEHQPAAAGDVEAAEAAPEGSEGFGGAAKNVHCSTTARAWSPYFAAAASRNLIVFESVKSWSRRLK